VIEDSTEWFDPDCVKKGDTIYINIWYLPWFAEQVHDLIRQPYILVSGDVGCWLPETRLNRLLYDPKLAAWFCRNIIFSYHPKLHQLPMGQDFSLFVLGENVKNRNILIESILNNTNTKEHKLYLNFFPRTFGDRDKILKMFENEPYCFARTRSDQVLGSFVAQDVYYDDLARSQFALSPLGLETDCVRTWEALALNCIPIVEHTFLDPVYDGLSVVKVHEWNQITEPFLEKKYQELKHLTCEKAFFDYWHKLIIDSQERVQNGDCSFSHLEATQFTDGDLKILCSILDQKPNANLIYRGCLTAIRPLQLAQYVPCIFLYDTWMDTNTFLEFGKYIDDESLLENKHKIWILESESDCQKAAMYADDCAIFIDFSHYRSSLQGPQRNIRHCLKKGLQEFYEHLPSISLVCGNMARDEYVSEVLMSFAEVNHLRIENRDPFWFFTKPPLSSANLSK